jgi:carbamoyl-phosphate synthase large subunit
VDTQLRTAEAAGTSLLTLGVVGAGIALIVMAVAWRVVRTVRIRRGIRAGLTDPDLGIRLAAVQQAAELGLASTAPALLRAVRDESEPDVLGAVVETVAARQWEPASTARVVELRLWARAYADQHPEIRRSGSSAPLLAGVAGSVPPPSLDPSRAADFRTVQDPARARADRPRPEPAVGVPDDPDPMHPVRVLVTGAGGPAGVAVIRSLKQHGHQVVAVDANPLAVGLRLADERHVVPLRTDPQYVAAVLRVATVGNVQALLCTVAEEYEVLVPATEYLEEAGIHTLMPALAAVRSCTDKWAFHRRISASGLPVPATNLGTDEGVPGPWVVKPRHGRGSRDVVVATTRTQLASALRTVPDPIVQTELTGREFTCDTLVDASGTLVAAVPRWRIDTRGGISTVGETFHDDEVVNVVGLVLKAVELTGPANVQGFVSEDGRVVVHEVNPRFSGGLPLSLAAGADLVEEYLRGVMGLPIRAERLFARPGVTMMRYFCEVFEG